ncbi:hypothetical protein Tco_0408353 [Tanacetum coccineum]
MEILLEPTSNKLLVDAPVMRMASAAAKPCQGDSSEFYLITGMMKFKVKELQERCIIKAFKLSYQEKYKHVGPEVTRSQEGKRLQDDDKRLCLVDDLKKLKITFMSRQRYKSKPKVKDHYINSQVKD